MADVREIEFVFEPQDEGGYHVYAPDLPGLHTQGETLEEATENAREALDHRDREHVHRGRRRLEIAARRLHGDGDGRRVVSPVRYSALAYLCVIVNLSLIVRDLPLALLAVIVAV
jgi:hypothetical protein